MKIVFCGTPSFALPALKDLVERGWVKAVVTQPGRPKGRGLKVCPSEVCLWARSAGLKVYEPETLLSIKDELLAMDIDVLVVAAYGKLIPTWLLNHPKEGCVNIHGSLLPSWRGAAPIHHALIAGDAYAGISIMRMEKGMDTGGYWMQRQTKIVPETTLSSLYTDLSQMGSEALCEVLEKKLHLMPPVIQDEDLVTYAPKITSTDTAYQEHYTIADIQRRLQAFHPKPGLRARVGSQLLCISSSGASRAYSHDHPSGTLLRLDDDGLTMATSDGEIAIVQLQLASQPKKMVSSMRSGWPKVLALGLRLESP